MLEQIYYVTQIAAVIGILISLILVLRQLKQTQQQLNRAEQANILDNATASRDFAMALASDPNLSDIVHRGRHGIDSLTREERTRYYNWNLGICMQTIAGLGLGWDEFYGKTDAHSLRMQRVHFMQMGQTLQTLNCEGGREFITRFGHMFAPHDRKTFLALAGLGASLDSFMIVPEGMPLPERLDQIQGGKWEGKGLG